MKKTFLAALSLCAFLTVSAHAEETKAVATEKKHHHKAASASDVDAKEMGLRAQIEKNAACSTVLGECKKLGFVAGGFKEGKGLWRNCFAPVVHGKSANLNGQDVAVTVNANDVASCKVAVKEIRKEKKEAKTELKKAEGGEAHAHKVKHAKGSESATNAPAAQQ